jgi:hypothetical protein
MREKMKRRKKMRERNKFFRLLSWRTGLIALSMDYKREIIKPKRRSDPS